MLRRRQNRREELFVKNPNRRVGNAIDSGMDLSITIHKLRVFINKTLSILSVINKSLSIDGAYQQLVDSR